MKHKNFILAGLLVISGLIWHAVNSQGTEMGGPGASNDFQLDRQLVIEDSATRPPMNITQRSSVPSSPTTGDIYLDDGTNCGGGDACFRRYTGAAWEELGDGSAALSPDSVNDTHIDWGSGANQVNFEDFDDQTAWRLFYSNTDGDVTELAFGASGTYLKSQGTTSAPTWDTPTGGASRWTAEDGSLADQDADTMRITTTDDCDTNYAVGTPVRYSDDQSTYYYGIVVACTDNGATLDVDIDGYPLSASNDAYWEYGPMEVVKDFQLAGVGNCAVSDTWFPKYLWSGQDAYLVRIYVYVDTAPTGAALEGNVELNGTNALDTEFSIAASGTSADSGTTIHDTYANALIEQDEFVEIDISQCGSTIPGGNAAWAKLVFIYP
jgi:hypothetical protein